MRSLKNRVHATASRTVLIVAFGVGVFLSYPTASQPICVDDDAQCRSIAEVTRVWSQFVALLKENRRSEALSFVTSDAAPIIEILRRPGGDARQFAEGIQRFDVIDVGQNYIRAVVVVRREGTESGYSVTFYRETEGWKIYSM